MTEQNKAFRESAFHLVCLHGMITARSKVMANVVFLSCVNCKAAAILLTVICGNIEVMFIKILHSVAASCCFVLQGLIERD